MATDPDDDGARPGQQFTFDFGEPPLPEPQPRRTARRKQAAFFAVLPEEPDRTLIGPRLERVLDDAYIYDGRLQPIRRHVSLACVAKADGLSDAFFEEMRRPLDGFEARAFDVMFDRAASFGGGNGKRPFVVYGGEGLEGMVMLQASLSERLFQGRPPWERPYWSGPYEPHMTLAYNPRVVTERPVVPLRWRARSVVLIQSFVGQTRHVIRGQWPLAI